ncbi:Major facilitator superfamily MFS_1 [Mycobacterium tuberculosis]|nr:Major facilitator superfamily MFS_1 [Mycobacterium tuberculosis]
MSRAETDQADRHDWPMLALAWLLYFSFAFTLASLFPLVGRVRADLGLSYAQVGVILGGWQLIYLAAAFPIGYLVDRFQPKWVLFAGTLIVAASQLARSFAGDFAAMLAAVAVLGLGGPGMSVGLPKIIAEFFSGRHRATASGVYITGAHLGQMSALAATSVIVDHLAGDSWRLALRYFAAAVLGAAVVWLLFAKRVDRSAQARVAGGALSGIKHVAAVPGVWLVIAVGFAGFLASHGFRSWLPELLSAKGHAPAQAGLLAAVPALCSMFGSIVILRHGSGRHRRVTAMLLLAVVGGVMPLTAITTGPPVYFAIAIEGFCAAALLPLMMNTLMEMPQIGPKYMGAAAGLYFTIGEMGGFAGPSVIGLMVGLTGSFTSGVLVLSLTMWTMLMAAARLPSSR